MKKVSIIIINYDGMPHIDRCILSIYDQTYSNYEIIFVDNASSDNSLSYAREKFPNLIIVANENNLGYAGGINSGIPYASGEYIAPLNIDTEVDSNWLATMVNFLDKNPNVGAVTPKIPFYNDRTKVSACGLNIHLTGLGFVRSMNRAVSMIPKDPLKVSGLSGCSYLIRKEIMDRIGGINEKCFMYYDDVDLSWMVNLLGYDIYCVPDSIVYHKYRLKMNPNKYFMLESNRYALLLETFNPITFIICSPALLVTEILTSGYCLLRGKAYLLSKIKSLQSIFQTLSDIKQRRYKIQNLRKISDFKLLRRLQITYEVRQFVNILR